MLLIFSGSIDGTCDRLMSILGHKAFRFNYDIFEEYQLEITPSKWKISNPTGLYISSETSTGAFWWKPFNYGVQIEKFIASEVKYIFKEIYAWHIRNGTAKGNPPDYHNRFGKIYFLNIASRYFNVPDSFVGWSFKSLPAGLLKGDVVAKSLASGSTFDNKSLFTTAVDCTKVDPNYPWFLQSKVKASHDVTVLICGSKKFCFEKSRDNLKSVDWRLDIDVSAPIKDEWSAAHFTKSELNELDKFCDDANIQWGRIDFMRAESGELYFLEFNANGQWVFLDYQRKNMLVEHVCHYLLA